MLKFVRTRLRRKLLHWIIHHPKKDHYVREIAALIDEDPGNCSRELTRFEQEGIVVSHKKAKAKFYSLNTQYAQLDIIHNLLSKQVSPEEKKTPVFYLCETKLRKKVLTYVLKNPDKEFYIREMASLIDEDPGNLSRTLRIFEEEGLFCSRLLAGAKFYQLQKEHPLCADLKEHLIKRKG